MRRKILVLFVLAAALLAASNAYALKPGDPFTFYDSEKPDYNAATHSWTQFIDGTFSPKGAGARFLNVTEAVFMMTFNFVADANKLIKFTPSFDGVSLGSAYSYSGLNKGNNFIAFWHITDPKVLKAFSDHRINIRLNMEAGNVTKVTGSTFAGSGTTAPEPLSMVLVGAGLAGLPILRRLRKQSSTREKVL